MSRLKGPGIDYLTSEQARILRLPDEGRYHIGGPPGTGKTIVALLRAHAMAARGNRTNVVVHNRLLQSYCKQWLESRRLRLGVDTYHRWFSAHFKRTYGAYPPELLDAAGQPRRWQYDWTQIQEMVAASPVQRDTAPLLIDEGQDLPRPFYQYVSVHFDNIMVFADENQTMDKKGFSAPEDIWAELNIPEENRHLLTTNHRNTREIALVAESFYAGTDAGKPTPPDNTGEVPRLVGYDHLEHAARFIMNLARNRPADLIAVMTISNQGQDAMKAHMESACREQKTRFTWYRSSSGASIDFNMAGIVLLNLQSAKGLEFEDVVIADLHEHYLFRDSQSHKMRLYVATSRAKERLYIMHDRTKKTCPILALMPGEDLLKRHALNENGSLL
jgi:superfamily I DNA/RNA helicase